MTQKNKDNAILDFQEMINHSWTWAKLTKEEKAQWFDGLETITHWTNKAVKGTYQDRWNMLQALYHIFLNGVGYTNWNWRESEV